MESVNDAPKVPSPESARRNGISSILLVAGTVIITILGPVMDWVGSDGAQYLDNGQWMTGLVALLGTLGFSKGIQAAFTILGQFLSGTTDPSEPVIEPVPDAGGAGEPTDPTA